MKIDIIGASCDLGVHVDGASLGPRVLIEKIKYNSKVNNIINRNCDCSNKSHDEKARTNCKKNILGRCVFQTGC